MSYYATITECNLYYSNSDSLPLNQKDYHYPWYNEGTSIFIEDRSIKWSDEFVNDLLHMSEQGIWGDIKVRTEAEELSLFKLTKDGVNEFYGQITYPNEPDVTHKKEEQ